jgi:hypothetical protein
MLTASDDSGRSFAIRSARVESTGLGSRFNGLIQMREVDAAITVSGESNLAVPVGNAPESAGV